MGPSLLYNTRRLDPSRLKLLTQGELTSPDSILRAAEEQVVYRLLYKPHGRPLGVVHYRD